MHLHLYPSAVSPLEMMQPPEWYSQLQSSSGSNGLLFCIGAGSGGGMVVVVAATGSIPVVVRPSSGRMFIIENAVYMYILLPLVTAINSGFVILCNTMQGVQFR